MCRREAALHRSVLHTLHPRQARDQPQHAPPRRHQNRRTPDYQVRRHRGNFSAEVFPNWVSPGSVSTTQPENYLHEFVGLRPHRRVERLSQLRADGAAQSGLSLASGLPGQPPAGWGYSYLDVMGGWMGGLALMQGCCKSKKPARVFTSIIRDRRRDDHGGHLHARLSVNGRRTRRPGFPPGNRAVFPQVAPHNTYAVRATIASGSIGGCLSRARRRRSLRRCAR